MVSAVRAANVILERAAEDGRPLTPLQVMKLVYIAHGFHLGKHGAPLMPEPIQAWQYGPVIKSLYQHMKGFGRNPIHPPRLPTTFFDHTEPTESELHALNSAYKVLGKFSGGALSNLTHKPGSPWSKVWRPGASNLVIPDDLIAEHYKEALAKGVLSAA